MTLIVPLVLRFPPASGSTTNDGAIPYGSTIISASALVHYLDDDSTGSTALLSTSPTAASSNNVTVWLTHTTSVNTGIAQCNSNGCLGYGGEYKNHDKTI